MTRYITPSFPEASCAFVRNALEWIPQALNSHVDHVILLVPLDIAEDEARALLDIPKIVAIVAETLTQPVNNLENTIALFEYDKQVLPDFDFLITLIPVNRISKKLTTKLRELAPHTEFITNDNREWVCGHIPGCTPRLTHPQKCKNLTEYLTQAIEYAKQNDHAGNESTIVVTDNASLSQIEEVLSIPSINHVLARSLSPKIHEKFPGKCITADNLSEHMPILDSTIVSLLPSRHIPTDILFTISEKYPHKSLLLPTATGWNLGTLNSLFAPPPQPKPTPAPSVKQPTLESIYLDAVLAPPFANFKPIPNKIIMLTDSLGSGGAERQLVATFKGLIERNIPDVNLLCKDLSTEESRFYLTELNDLGVIPKVLPEAYQIPLKTQHEILDRCDKFSAQLRSNELLSYIAYLQNEKPSVLHIWQDIPEAALAGVLVGIPKIVLSWQNVAPFHFDYYREAMLAIYRAIHASPNVIFTNNSIAGGDDYAQWLDIDTKNIHTLYNGIDPEIWKKADDDTINSLKAKLSIPKGVPVIGALYRFFKEKDPELWVKTAKEISLIVPETHFVLFGEGPLLDSTRQLVESLDFGDQFHLPSRTDKAAEAYSILDIFLLTSHVEGVPNVLLEAQLIGLPVVTTRAGGTPEAISSGITGFVVEKRDPKVLAQTVVTILKKPLWLQRAKQQSRSYISNKFGIDKMLDTTMAAYGMLL